MNIPKIEFISHKIDFVLEKSADTDEMLHHVCQSICLGLIVHEWLNVLKFRTHFFLF